MNLSLQTAYTVMQAQAELDSHVASSALLCSNFEGQNNWVVDKEFHNVLIKAYEDQHGKMLGSEFLKIVEDLEREFAERHQQLVASCFVNLGLKFNDDELIAGYELPQLCPRSPTRPCRGDSFHQNVDGEYLLKPLSDTYEPQLITMSEQQIDDLVTKTPQLKCLKLNSTTVLRNNDMQIESDKLKLLTKEWHHGMLNDYLAFVLTFKRINRQLDQKWEGTQCSTCRHHYYFSKSLMTEHMACSCTGRIGALWGRCTPVPLDSKSGPQNGAQYVHRAPHMMNE